MSNTTGEAEKFFKDFGKKIDLFVKELHEANARLKNDFEEKLSDLRKSGGRLKKEIENKQRWKEVETSLKRAGEELENAFTAAFKKRTSKKTRSRKKDKV